MIRISDTNLSIPCLSKIIHVSPLSAGQTNACISNGPDHQWLHHDEAFILLCSTDEDTMVCRATEQSLKKLIMPPSSSIMSDTIVDLEEKIPFSTTALVKDDEILVFKKGSQTDCFS